MSRKIQFFIQAFLMIGQAIGEPAADHFGWSNTFQILYHTLLGSIQLQLGAYAQQFNIDGTRPLPGTVTEMHSVEIHNQPVKQEHSEE